MRKFLGIAGIVLVLGLAAAPAALAQDTPAARDPFAPLFVPGEPGGSTTDPTNPTDPTVPVVPDPVDPLPDTGSSTSSWLGLSYFFVAFGAGAVVLSKVLGPPRVPLR